MIGNKIVLILLFVLFSTSLIACSDDPYECWIMGEGNYCWGLESVENAKKVYDELIAYAKELDKIKSVMSKRDTYLVRERAKHIFICCVEPGVMWQTKEEYEKTFKEKNTNSLDHPYWKRIRELKTAEDEDE